MIFKKFENGAPKQNRVCLKKKGKGKGLRGLRWPAYPAMKHCGGVSHRNVSLRGLVAQQCFIAGVVHLMQPPANCPAFNAGLSLVPPQCFIAGGIFFLFFYFKPLIYSQKLK